MNANTISPWAEENIRLCAVQEVLKCLNLDEVYIFYIIPVYI